MHILEIKIDYFYVLELLASQYWCKKPSSIIRAFTFCLMRSHLQMLILDMLPIQNLRAPHFFSNSTLTMYLLSFTCNDMGFLS